MLPFSSLPSIQKKLKLYQYREEHLIDVDAEEQEKSTKFGLALPNPKKKKLNYARLLLDPESDSADTSSKNLRTVSSSSDSNTGLDEEEKSQPHISEPPKSEITRDWTLVPFSAEVQADLRCVYSFSVSIPAASGSSYNTEIDSNSIKRIPGHTGENVLAWLDDNTINCFMGLLNDRSERMTISEAIAHKRPSKKQSVSRKRVRIHVFNSHVFEILRRSTNGGYEGVKKWRRKIRNYNAIDVYMFPAFIRNNHWALAIIDIVRRKLIYYDPYHRPDDQMVMKCALNWINGEVKSAMRGDVFKGLRPS